MQHMITLDEQKAHLDVWERVNDKVPLAGLHWAIDHGYGMDLGTLNRAKALGVGIAAHSTAYLAGRAMENGNPPFRMMLESGIHVGGGSDGARISTMNPWLMIYYMVTGRNCAGELINPGQTITRMEALRLWTAAQGWFSKEEDGLGSIEVGKMADLVVLSDDYLDPDAVSDEQIRDLSSVLTIVGGEIVHDTGALA
jgi:predicted amidohydrolase YtcJ